MRRNNNHAQHTHTFKSPSKQSLGKTLGLWSAGPGLSMSVSMDLGFEVDCEANVLGLGLSTAREVDVRLMWGGWWGWCEADVSYTNSKAASIATHGAAAGTLGHEEVGKYKYLFICSDFRWDFIPFTLPLETWYWPYVICFSTLLQIVEAAERGRGCCCDSLSNVSCCATASGKNGNFSAAAPPTLSIKTSFDWWKMSHFCSGALTTGEILLGEQPPTKQDPDLCISNNSKSPILHFNMKAVRSMTCLPTSAYLINFEIVNFKHLNWTYVWKTLQIVQFSNCKVIMHAIFGNNDSSWRVFVQNNQCIAHNLMPINWIICNKCFLFTKK